MVGLLDLVVIAGYVGMMERERGRKEEMKRDGREEGEVNCFFYLMV